MADARAMTPRGFSRENRMLPAPMKTFVKSPHSSGFCTEAESLTNSSLKHENWASQLPPDAWEEAESHSTLLNSVSIRPVACK